MDSSMARWAGAAMLASLTALACGGTRDTVASGNTGGPPGTILPTGGQAALDKVAQGYYDVWKAVYLKTGCDGYYVDTGGGTGTAGTDTITVSEGHGYGMLI